MKDIIIDTLLDTAKIVPFLFVAFLIIELIEHKLNNKNILTKSKKYSVILGSFLGIIPQCGLSVIATNLYITRIITLGTLISIYLSTSDEMLPILISEHASFSLIAEILIIKFILGIFYGSIIDLILKKRKRNESENYQICDHDHCHCEDGIIKPTIKHTINITLFMLIITFLLNIIFAYLGEEFLSKIFLKGSIFAPLISSLIGLIPNCGASVILTELYINNTINISSLISGLLTGSGTALIILFKENHNLKENFSILILLYLLGSLSGIIIELFEILI